MTTKLGHGGSTVSNRYKPIHARGREKKLTFAFSLTRFFVVHFVAKQYILQQKCLNRQIGTYLLGTRWYNF